MARTKDSSERPFATPSDGLGDQRSAEAAISFPVDEDLTRQDEKDNADINVIVKRFGVQAFQPHYGEHDFTLDLLEAHRAIAEVESWVRERAPRELLDANGGARGLVGAILHGTVREPVKPDAEGAAPPRPEGQAPKPAEPAREL